VQRVRRRLTAIVGMTVIMVGGAVAATPAYAGTGLYYQAVDADNDPYSGIYLRDGTSMSNVRRITSRYMYYGNTFELICGTWGEAVGPNANRRWHSVYVINGPATGQTGWIADRYTNTPNLANQYTPGEPECGAPPPPPAASYNGSVNFAPHSNGDGPGSNATIHKWLPEWTAPDCGVGNVSNFPSWLSPSNKYITTLAGWSVGRLGPVYFLEANKSNPSGRWQEIDYILLIDPGDYDLLVGGENLCDLRYDTGMLYANWLKANPNAKLVILAGAATELDGHRGIQEAYFNDIRASGAPRDRVLVCNYNGMDHTQIFLNFRDSMNSPPALPLDHNDCPGTENWAWHP